MAFLNETGLSRLWTHILARLDTKVNKEDALALDPNDTAIEGEASAVNANTLNGMTYDDVVEDIKSDITYSDVGAASATHTHTGMYTTDNLVFSLSGTELTITKS